MPQKPKNVMPWDLLNPNTEYVPAEVYDERYEICKNCEFFNSLTRQCKICKCFMRIKCSMVQASCPENKWTIHENK